MSIEEQNKMVAEFMGLKLGEEKYSWWPGVTEPLRVDHLNYHASWGWLMPVVEKIEGLGFDSRILGHDSDGGFLCDFVDFENNEAACSTSHETKIKAVFNAVLQFITWYTIKN